jgi:UDP-glucose 4-epimerase
MDLTNKRILITGANGYLGTFLHKELEKFNPELYSISKNIENSDKSFKIDLTDDKKLNKIVQTINPDIVYHLAANINRDRDQSIYTQMFHDNVQGTMNLLIALEHTDCKQFIFSSSSEIYGDNKSPFHENQIPKPVSPYSTTKVLAELYIQDILSSGNISFTIARIFNFYGPGMSESFFISEMIQKLKSGNDFHMTQGEQYRDFLYIDDVVAALILMVQNPNSNREIFNVCSGKGLQIKELALEVEKYFEAKIILGSIPYRENEVWEMIGDNSKIQSILGFQAKVGLNEGIKLLINN